MRTFVGCLFCPFFAGVTVVHSVDDDCLSCFFFPFPAPPDCCDSDELSGGIRFVTERADGGTLENVKQKFPNCSRDGSRRMSEGERTKEGMGDLLNRSRVYRIQE
jgi:hypothetical protein